MQSSYCNISVSLLVILILKGEMRPSFWSLVLSSLVTKSQGELL